MVLGPCESLIPLMFLASAHGWHAVLVLSLLFGGITVGMMVGETLLAHHGVRLLTAGRWERWSHTLAGLVIAVTGVLVWALGL